MVFPLFYKPLSAPVATFIPVVPRTDYIINIKTSDRAGAATDSEVFIQMFGQFGISEPIKLEKSNRYIKFRRDQLDQFIFRHQVGWGLLYAVKVWHDDCAVGANWLLEYFNSAWHLEYVEISDVRLALSFRFPCHRWFSISKDDGKLCRQFRCTEITQGPKRTVQNATGYMKCPTPSSQITSEYTVTSKSSSLESKKETLSDSVLKHD